MQYMKLNQMFWLHFHMLHMQLLQSDASQGLNEEMLCVINSLAQTEMESGVCLLIAADLECIL